MRQYDLAHYSPVLLKQHRAVMGLMILNTLESAWIYLNKQSSKYARIQIVADVVHSLRSMYK